MNSRTQITIIFLRSVLFALALAAPAGCGEKIPPLPRLATGDVVLAFGDSLTYGTGAGENQAYPRVLAGLIGRDVVGAGVPGEVTAQGLERLPGLIEEVKPKILLLCLGGNDMLKKLDGAATQANLRAMVQLARERGVGVVLIGVPQPALFGGTVEFYEKIAREFQIPLEDKILHEVLFDKAFKSDQIHPNEEGYRRMAEAIAELLRKAGAI
jgi:acyl-CoA thioesterase I